MSNLHKLITISLVVLGVIMLFFLIKTFDQKDNSFLNLFNEYQTKGKESRFTVDDIRNSFK